MIKNFFYTAIALFFTLQVSAAQVDFFPPSWWVGMKNKDLQVMFYGDKISDYKLNIQSKQIKLAGTTVLPNPNYLLVNFDLTQLTEPEKLKLTFFKDNDRFIIYYDFFERQKGSAKRYGVTTQDLIYLIMPDRFANGDTTNDIVAGMLDSSLNRNEMYHRHGGDLLGIQNNLDYLVDLGATALWLNPVLENNQPKASYHGYAITNHYKIDPRFGTNLSYKNFVDSCHAKGLKVIQDVVYNHVGNEHWFIKDLPYKEWVHNVDTFGRTNFRATTLFDPYASDYDKKRFKNGWFDDHMPDLDFSTEYIKTYFIQNTIWWLEYANLDGLRIDTYAYPDQDFMNEWVDAVKFEYPKLLMFGETWVHGPGVQSFFAENIFTFEKEQNTLEPKEVPEKAKLPNVTDFQMYYAINNALNQNADWSKGISEIYYVLAQDYLYKNPKKHVIFLDNHDLSRFYSVVNQDLEKFKMGIALLFTLRGIPQIYYGTEILMQGLANPDGKVRQDFPGGWPTDNVNKFTEEGRTALENEAFNYVKKLANYRKNSVVLKEGELKQFIPENGVYTFFRYRKEGTIMVMINTSNEKKFINTDKYAEMTDGWVNGLDIVSGEGQKIRGEVSIPPKTIRVIELKK